MKAEIDNNTVTVRDFSTPLSTMDRSPRHKINKEMDFNYTLDQIDLTDIYTFHVTAVEYTFFSSVHRIFRDRSYDKSENKSKQNF